MQFNIPTLLTLFRVILIPFFVLVFYLPVTWSPFAAALIFCVAAVTDWFDGFLARRWNQSTRFGAFLDPVADKVLVAIAHGAGNRALSQLVGDLTGGNDDRP